MNSKSYYELDFIEYLEIGSACLQLSCLYYLCQIQNCNNYGSNYPQNLQSPIFNKANCLCKMQNCQAVDHMNDSMGFR